MISVKAQTSSGSDSIKFGTDSEAFVLFISSKKDVKLAFV